jgi:hypothetical protein
MEKQALEPGAEMISEKAEIGIWRIPGLTSQSCEYAG